jgi:hypothetical protein
MFYMSKQTPKQTVKFFDVYRCNIQNKNKGRNSHNHKGKAADLHIYTEKDGKPVRSSDSAENKTICDEVRGIFKDKMSSQIRWGASNKLSLEPSEGTAKEALATTWVHIDVRAYESKYLEDRFFAKDAIALDGNPMVNLFDWN